MSQAEMGSGPDWPQQRLADLRSSSHATEREAQAILAHPACPGQRQQVGGLEQLSFTRILRQMLAVLSCGE